MPLRASSLAAISAAVLALSSEAFAQAGPCDLLLADVGLATPTAEAIAKWKAKGLVESAATTKPRQRLQEALDYVTPNTKGGEHGRNLARRIVGQAGDTTIEFSATYTAQGKRDDWKAWPVAAVIQSRIDAFCGGKTLADSEISCKLKGRATAVYIEVSPPLDAPRPFCSYKLNVHVAPKRPGKVGGMREELRLRVSPMTPKERQMLKALKKRKKKN